MKKRRLSWRFLRVARFYCVSIGSDTLRGELGISERFSRAQRCKPLSISQIPSRRRAFQHAGCYIEREDKTSEPAFSFFERAASVVSLSCEFPSIGVSETDPRSYPDESQWIYCTVCISFRVERITMKIDAPCENNVKIFQPLCK